jgi:hypothetical protein
VIQIHGGAFRGGDKRLILPFVDWPGVLASLAARGYVVASIKAQAAGTGRRPYVTRTTSTKPQPAGVQALVVAKGNMPVARRRCSGPVDLDVE